MIGGSEGPVVALIPARGGSKRIPRKNIRPFRGVPLLARTVGLALSAGLFDRVVVSTDDEEIADVAAAAGAEAPFRRPAELADDHTGTRAVVHHALRELEDSGPPVDALCLLYPAAVFVAPDDLARAKGLLDDDVDFVISATTYPAPIQRALRLRDDGTCEMLWPEHLRSRSQDLEETFHDAGQFYWGRRDAWLIDGSVLTARTRLHLLPHWRVQDIDSLDDWQRAELIHRMLDDG